MVARGNPGILAEISIADPLDTPPFTIGGNKRPPRF
jgi:hypothetical protein